MGKHYTIEVKPELPTVTLYDLYLEAIAEAMQTTVEEAKRIFKH